MSVPLPRDLNNLCGIIGTIIHSLKFGEIEIIDHGLLVYDGAGLIRSVVDLKKEPNALNLISLHHLEDFTGKLIIPGFVDAHCHAPQYVFSGTGMDLPLLQWLEKYTFPCEAKFSDKEFAKIAYEKSIRRHLKCGTTFASYFATIHNEAGKILVDIIQEVGQRAFVGKVSMDRNSPEFYVEKTTTGCKDAEEFVKYVLRLTDVGKQFVDEVDNCVSEWKIDKSFSSNFVAESSSMKKPRTVSEDATTVCSSASSVRNLGNLSVKGSKDFDGTNGSRARVVSGSTAFDSMDSDSVEEVSSNEGNSTRSKRTLSDFYTDMKIGSCVPFCPKVNVAYPTKTLLNRKDTPLVMPCITPRFVPTCTPGIMMYLGELAQRYGLPVQSHMSESINEIQWVAELHPDCETYAHVYEKFGLLSPYTYMAHCCHSSAEERQVLRRTGTSAIHCASSNFMLNSGVMDVKLFLSEGINVALGTDVAGGYSPSILDAIRQTVIASRVKGFDHRSRANSIVNTDVSIESESMKSTSSKSVGEYQSLNFAEAFHLATVGGAEVLGMGNVVGNFMVGKKLDCLVVDLHCSDSPIDCFGNEDSNEMFQKFLFLGDDRNISHVYVDGRQVL
jgi:cytosine/adenosine deaminase-related metal-dependent hydrolase